MNPTNEEIDRVAQALYEVRWAGAQTRYQSLPDALVTELRHHAAASIRAFTIEPKRPDFPSLRTWDEMERADKCEVALRVIVDAVLGEHRPKEPSFSHRLSVAIETARRLLDERPEAGEAT